MSQCSGQDCDHSSHKIPDEIEKDLRLEEMADEKFSEAEPPVVEKVEMKCLKCGQNVMVRKEAPNPVHGDCGGGELYLESEGPKSIQPKVQVPPHAVFSKGELITLKGFHFRFVGYNKADWNLVFEVAGRTNKSLKKFRTG